MITQIFTVYDSKAEYYSAPFFLATVATAIRSFEDIVNTPDHPYSKHPADYTLFHIGQFDDNTCFFECEIAHVNLGTALSYVQTQTRSEDLFKNEAAFNEKS